MDVEWHYSHIETSVFFKIGRRYFSWCSQLLQFIGILTVSLIKKRRETWNENFFLKVCPWYLFILCFLIHVPCRYAQLTNRANEWSSLMQKFASRMAGRTIRPRLRSRLSAIIMLRAQIMRDSRFTAYVYGAIYTVERKCGGFNGFGISYTPLDGCIHVRGLVACYDVVDEFSRRLCCKAPASWRG